MLIFEIGLFLTLNKSLFLGITFIRIFFNIITFYLHFNIITRTQIIFFLLNIYERVRCKELCSSCTKERLKKMNS